MIDTVVPRHNIFSENNTISDYIIFGIKPFFIFFIYICVVYFHSKVPSKRPERKTRYVLEKLLSFQINYILFSSDFIACISRVCLMVFRSSVNLEQENIFCTVKNNYEDKNKETKSCKNLCIKGLHTCEKHNCLTQGCNGVVLKKKNNVHIHGGYCPQCLVINLKQCIEPNCTKLITNLQDNHYCYPHKFCTVCGEMKYPSIKCKCFTCKDCVLVKNKVDDKCVCKCIYERCFNLKYKESSFCIQHCKNYCKVLSGDLYCGNKLISGYKQCIDHTCIIFPCRALCSIETKLCNGHTCNYVQENTRCTSSCTSTGRCIDHTCPHCIKEEEEEKYEDYHGSFISSSDIIHCKYHNCSVTNCRSMIIFGETRCKEHTCPLCNVENDVIEYNSGNILCCVDHKCILSFCSSIRTDGTNYCIDHKCKVSECKDDKTTDSLYCKKHTCKFCNDITSELNEFYCSKHSCDINGCKNDKKCILHYCKHCKEFLDRGNYKWCNDCKCIYPSCKKQRTFWLNNFEYCKEHTKLLNIKPYWRTFIESLLSDEGRYERLGFAI